MLSMPSADDQPAKEKLKEARIGHGLRRRRLAAFASTFFQQRGNVGMVLRVIPTKLRTSEEESSAGHQNKICEEQRGLVLVTCHHRFRKSQLPAMIDSHQRTAPINL